MQRLSYYNIFVPFHKKHMILFNSFSGLYCLLTQDTYNIICKYDLKLDKLEVDYPNIYSSLLRNGCIVSDEFDEYQCVETMKMQKRFDSNEYQLIINPTMDCNLGCWYCYENHIPNSEISDAVISKIIAHLYERHRRSPFKKLLLGFFGGEPLLKEQQVMKILNGIDDFCNNNDVELIVDFTTNCTVLSDDLLEYFKKFIVSFQITLDGDKKKHNEVRHYKNSSHGSYDKIITNLRRITDSLDNYGLNLRINFDDSTLNKGLELLDDIDFINREKVQIGIHKVWQISETSTDVGKVLEFIAEASKRKFKVEFQQMYGFRDHICYADLYNEAVINYDGNVFKCTARSFSEELRDGILLNDGKILWDADKIRKRMFLTTPKECVKCKLFPACTGFCSQHLMESDKWECQYLKNYSIEEQVIINFQQQYLQNNISRL